MSKLVIVSQVWPEPNSSAAGSRMMQLIGIFSNFNYEITFACTASDQEHAVNLREIGVQKQKIEVNNSSFDTFIESEAPDVVLFDRFMLEEQFGWRVAQICPDALRILDTEDLHFLRKARQEVFKKNRNFKKTDLYSEVAKREIASILRCDLSLVISQAEQKLLEEDFGIKKNLLFYLPFLLQPLSSEQLEAFPTFEERQHFISIGNFLHPPNWDKTLYLKQNIWPLIRQKLPEAELHVYGAYASQKVDQLHQPKTGFLVKGRTQELSAVFQHARILLAPLRFGAGLKGKFIDAMKNGTPAVTTTIGAEGMCGEYPWPGEIGNTAEEFAAAAVTLYQNKKRWKKAQTSGQTIINKRFQEADFANVFMEEIEAIQHHLQQHRQQNFIGGLLMHHTLQSTKYMSLWIEAKNKQSKK